MPQRHGARPTGPPRPAGWPGQAPPNPQSSPDWLRPPSHPVIVRPR
ncbi:hypothetical protein [Alloactinosynnema sp. L-07]|nr:hypothetical protein [Alloactinosynnema sp. L-07]